MSELLCSICEKAFARKASLNAHIRTIHGQSRNYRCSICAKAFKTDVEALVHRRSAHKNLCPFCNSSFVSAQELSEHVQEEHEATEDQVEKDSTSSLCSTQADSSPQLQCEGGVCNESTFSTKPDHEAHVCEGQEKSEDFRCGICDLGFSEQELVTKHIYATHGTGKPFKCKVCKEAFSVKRGYADHLCAFKVTGPLLKCGICEEQFSGRGRLTKHIFLTHSVIKAFQCKSCHKAFSLKNDYAKLECEEQKKGSQFSCTLCKMVFNGLGGLIQHINEEHS